VAVPVGVVVHKSNQWAYVLNPGAISQYSIDSKTGILTAIGSVVSTLNVYGGYGGPISTDLSGQTVFVTSPYTSDISQFSVDPITGQLSPLIQNLVPNYFGNQTVFVPH
jgi:6-phosphogluconolactonase (cycloisomerase 2 family)